MSLQVRPRSSCLRCVVCHAVVRHATVATCEGCGVVAHRGCARALEACPSLGCTGALLSPARPATSIRRRPALLHASASVLLAGAALAFGMSTSPSPSTSTSTSTGMCRWRHEALLPADPIERGEAVLALGATLREPSTRGARTRAVELLLHTAARDPESYVRARCEAAFADGNAERARGDLERALGHADAEVRLVVADLLGGVPQVWSRLALLARVDPAREPDARVRAVAAARLLLVLARMGDRGAAVFSALERRERDEPDPLVWVILRAGLNERAHGSCALVARTLPVLIDAAVRIPGRVGAACRDLLHGLDPCDAREPLLTTLEGGDPEAAALAATLLGRFLEPLGRCVVRGENVASHAALERACTDGHADVRNAARGALAAAEGTQTRRVIYTCCGPRRRGR